MTTVAITEGFSADVEMLLNRFVKQNSINFDCFCAEWNRMNFQYVFCGYMCLSEMVQFLDDAFLVLKRALLNATSHFEKIGALYLMYAMYFKQPPKQYCKFRMTLPEWMKVNQFYNDIYLYHQQASLVFWKLIQHDAFRFVEAEHEYGFERFMQKGTSDSSDDSKFRKINPLAEATITAMKDKKTGIIPAMEILQVGYNEMKEHLSQSSSAMSATTIATDILKGLESIEKLFKVDAAVNDAQENSDSGGGVGKNAYINTKRRQLKKKAFEGERATSSETTKNTAPTKYRTAITDDGEFIIIEKAVQRKPQNKCQLNDRQIKTFVKQLDVPIEEESSIGSVASTSRTNMKKEKDPAISN